jgi:hypothetical protein
MAILLSELLKEEEDCQPTHTHENRERETNLQINNAVEVAPNADLMIAATSISISFHLQSSDFCKDP